jgi:hypothetical protein
MSKLAFVLALALVVVTGATSAAPPDPQAEPARLAKDRALMATRVYAEVDTDWQAGKATLDQLVAWSVRVLDSAVDAGAVLADALDGHVSRMQAIEKAVQQRFKAGLESSTDVYAVAYFRGEAELWKARGKR